MDIAVGTRRMGGSTRPRGPAVAVQAMLIVLAAALLIVLAASRQEFVGDPGAHSPRGTVQVAPHPMPAPLGS